MTTVVLDRAELAEIVRRAVAEGVADALAQRPAGESKRLTRAEFAGLLGVSLKTFDKRNAEGQVPKPTRVGKGRKLSWSRATVDRWLAAGSPSRRRWEAMEAAG